MKVLLQGSGWTWLGYNPANKSLEIATSPNQDILDKQVATLLGCLCPLSRQGSTLYLLIPLFYRG